MGKENKTKRSRNLKAMDFSKGLKKFTNTDDVKNGIAYYGQTNDLPRKYLALLDDSKQDSTSSTWHSICVDAITRFIEGDGMSSTSGEVPSSVNSYGETLNDILSKVASDFKILGGFALEVIWTTGTVAGTSETPEISDVYAIPFKDIRAAESDYRGMIPGWYISSNWKKYRTVEDPNVEFIPSFNPTKVTNQDSDGNTIRIYRDNETMDRPPEPKQILVVTRHNPNSQYYPEPDYKGALTDIFIDSLVRDFKFNKMNIDIATGLIFDIPGEIDDDIYDEVVTDFETHYQSTDNVRPMLYNSPGGGDRLNVIQVTNSKGHAETYNSYVDDSRQRILSSHGITFSEIVGIDDGKSIFGDQKAEKYQTWLNTTIRALQMPILRGFNKLAPYLLGNGDTFTIDPIDIFEGTPLSGTTPPEPVNPEA